MSNITYPKLDYKQLASTSRSRTDLAFASFGERELPAVTKTYHPPRLSSLIRRMLSEELVSSGYISLNCKGHVSHEVERLREFAKRGLRVPEIYQVSEHSFTMEFIPYASAEEHLLRGQMQVTDNVLTSLNEVHRKGLTHGDFYPANILPISEQQSAIIDPGYKFLDQDQRTGMYRDLAQALFRLSAHIYEFVPVLRRLKEVYHDQQILNDFGSHLQKTSSWQRFLTNLVFRDGTVFSRMERNWKAVFKK